jgi:hypothetical protein
LQGAEGRTQKEKEEKKKGEFRRLLAQARQPNAKLIEVPNTASYDPFQKTPFASVCFHGGESQIRLIIKQASDDFAIE